MNIRLVVLGVSVAVITYLLISNISIFFGEKKRAANQVSLPTLDFEAKPTPTDTPQPSTKPAENNSVIISQLQASISALFETQQKQTTTINLLQAANSTQSAELKKLQNRKSLLSTVSTRQGSYTTSSSSYSSTGLYLNANCTTKCQLWVDFYTESRNQTAPNSAEGYLNTYGLFINGADQGIKNQANILNSNISVPVTFNALVLLPAGVHTVEVRSKTTGGVLESKESNLQVLVFEQ